MRDEVSRLEVPGELRLEVPELVPQAVPFPEDGSPRLLDRPQELGHPPVQVVRRGALVDERKEQERALVDGDLAPVHGHALQVPRTARSSEGIADEPRDQREHPGGGDRKSTRLNSSHPSISYAVFCLKKKKKNTTKHLTPYNSKIKKHQ